MYRGVREVQFEHKCRPFWAKIKKMIKSRKQEGKIVFVDGSAEQVRQSFRARLHKNWS